MTEPERFAAGLTKAQREAVLNFDWKVMPPEYWYLEPTGHDLISHWLLPTNKAVAVRAILERQADNG